MGLQLQLQLQFHHSESYMVEFNEEFNVHTSGRGDYKSFIEGLRSRLGDGKSFSRNRRPVLPHQEDPPTITTTRWFDVILRTNSHFITLRIRRTNLYLHAYQRENSAQWFEFGNSQKKSIQLITGSTFLGFEGDYDALQSAATKKDKQSAASNKDKKNLADDISLGKDRLRAAVDQLAVSSTNELEKARSLFVVIQMICESIRFDRISNHLAATFLNNLPPPSWMKPLEHEWSPLSEWLLRADTHPDEDRHKFQTPSDFLEIGIKTIEDAAQAIGILLRPMDCSKLGKDGKFVVRKDKGASK